MHKSVFCDEFGNSGPRLLDTAQPVLVYAFVLILPEDLSRIATEVRRLYQRERLTVAELKSSTLQGSRRGQARYARIGRIAIDGGAEVCLSVVEKRYQACVMIVESYLDPLLHDRAPRELYEPRFRQRFADACYDYLDDDRLSEFLNCVRMDDPIKIAEVGARLSRTLQFHSDDFISSAARLMETRPDHVCRYSQKLSHLPKNSDLPASQYAAFYPGLELVDAHLERADATGDLIRDEDLQFGDVLDEVFSQSKSSEGAIYRQRLSMTRIRTCQSVSSENDFGIQLADLVAGLFGRVASQTVRQQTLSASLARIADSWRPVLAPPNVHYLMVADSVLPHTMRALFGAEAP